ncbi:MAG TPA: aminotransferase class I/II-fold pyridoxal phosphate-dependent enzyme [Candidatus Marinimicrobia bacterium]|nr:aminotransferase class I/II-fold pyridoxal phosphate-dependent enzyme [Candidatus Neomarinimicrobiota bacterium]
MAPNLSSHFENRLPSAIREAQIIFTQREDKNEIQVVNLAIGNVSLPMHPAMQNRLNEMGEIRFKDGVVKYTPSVGTDEAREAFLNIIGSEGVDTSHLYCMITDGGSQAMELMMLGVCGPSSEKPLMLLDPAYTNYIEFGKRLSIPIVTANREISDDGTFEPLALDEIEKIITENAPGGLLVIPTDNPTGQFLNQRQLIDLAKICVNHNIWIVSDEAYRQLYYGEDGSSSIWKITEEDVPGITRSRISIESSSKVWNACGLRIGGLVTDNLDFHTKAVSEYTANLCANAIGQEIFGSLAHESHHDLNAWYQHQRNYYSGLIMPLRENLMKEIPGLIVSNPEAAIYFVIDFRNICADTFDSRDFVKYCASKGKVRIDDQEFTLLLAPMNGFYSDPKRGKTQMRVAMVAPKELIEKTPLILSGLYTTYLIE